MRLSNYDLYDLHALLLFFRNEPDQCVYYKAALQKLAAYIRSTSDNNALYNNVVRTIMRHYHNEADTQIAWVQTDNTPSENAYSAAGNHSAGAVLAAMLDEIATHCDDKTRTTALCSAVQNVPLLIMDTTVSKNAIDNEITQYRAQYDPTFLTEELKLFRKKQRIKKRTLWDYIFIASLLYYVYWLIRAVISMSTGIDSGWLIPSLSSHTMEYGSEALFETIGMGIIYTMFYLWCIPLYQVLYLITKGVKRLKKANRKTR